MFIFWIIGALICIPIFNFLGKGADKVAGKYGSEATKARINSKEFQEEQKKEDAKDKSAFKYYLIALIVIIVVIIIASASR
jgi:Na+/H+ antiporter NhaC